MKGFKYIGILLTFAVASMFLFPIEFRALPPGMNTKKLMAAAALVILLWKLIQKHELKMNKDFLYLSILAGLVSFFGIVSVTYNSTEDYTYATYISSCWVWWGAAYAFCSCIKWVHGQLDFRLIINYLALVCVFQCIIALVMDSSPNVKNAINSVVLQEDLVFMGNVHRLYGIGATLDVAGSRFSAVLLMLMFLLATPLFEKRWYEYLLYLSAFIIITVAGNMIARTTMVGVIIAFLYVAFTTFKKESPQKHRSFAFWYWFAGILFISVPPLTYAYNNDPQMQKHIRFGFEGFFNWVEKGNFNYTSNNRLKEMYVWPDNTKTWIIGDGYFNNPDDIDPYYTGEIYKGYYKSTDVGYMRFIFYFGVLGLLMFSFYFIEVGRTCMRRFPEWKMLFLMLLLVHFTVWAKVSTDIFLCFAPFLCLGPENDETRLSDSSDM